MITSRLCRSAVIVATTLVVAPAAAQQTPPPGRAWNKYLYAQDAVKQGKIDTNMLNQMSAMVSAQGTL